MSIRPTQYLFSKKKVLERLVTQNSVGEGEVLVILMPAEMVPEHHSGLRPSEKELPEQRSVTKILLVLPYRF
jgi:hypothetical protein